MFSGNLTKQSFTAISSWTIDGCLIKENNQVKLNDIIINDGSTSLEVRNLEFHNKVSRSWRLLYIGNQSSLRIGN